MAKAQHYTPTPCITRGNVLLVEDRATHSLVATFWFSRTNTVVFFDADGFFPELSVRFDHSEWSKKHIARMCGRGDNYKSLYFHVSETGKFHGEIHHPSMASRPFGASIASLV